MAHILLKRIYEDARKDDGYRVFMDRIWPRGLTKEQVKFDEWRKNLAPSTELRKWFHLDKSSHWNMFAERYQAELQANPDLKSFLASIEKYPVVTLLTAAKDIRHCHLFIFKKLVDKSV